MVVPGGAWPALAPGPTDRGTRTARIRSSGRDSGAWSISVKSCRTEASVDSGLRGKGYEYVLIEEL